jgi:hypothetical protein
MLVSVVSISLVWLFALLAGLHVYWALGGRWGADAAIPEIGGRKAFHPSKGVTLAVAALLLCAGATIALRADLVTAPFVPEWIVRLGSWGVSLLFGARAIGDFQTFGFAKRVKGTRFARYDTALFSPLCVGIAIGCAVVSAAR